MELYLNISTLGTKVNTDNYPLGRYSLNIIDQNGGIEHEKQDEKSDHPSQSVNWHCLNSNGLSISRNKGLSVVADNDAVVLIGDDDVKYYVGFDAAVIKAYEKYPDSDVILFMVNTPDGGSLRSYPRKMCMLGYKRIMNACSIEISFRMKSIEKIGVKFDERFGLGAEYCTGEDIIFLADCLKHNLKIIFVPIRICEHPDFSSGKKIDSATMAGRGAMFSRVFGSRLGVVAALAFCIKKTLVGEYAPSHTLIKTCLMGALNFKA